VPPGPDELLEAGRASGDIPSPLTILMNLFHQYGDIVQFRTRYNSFYLINDPARWSARSFEITTTSAAR